MKPVGIPVQLQVDGQTVSATLVQEVRDSNLENVTHVHTHSLSLSLECPHTQAVGSVSMAYQCFKLSLTANNSHSEAYNNLGVIEWRRGRGEQVSVCVGGWVDGWMLVSVCMK